MDPSETCKARRVGIRVRDRYAGIKPSVHFLSRPHSTMRAESKNPKTPNALRHLAFGGVYPALKAR